MINQDNTIMLNLFSARECWDQPKNLLQSLFFGCSSELYEIQVQTRDIRKAGTDNNVYCTFIAHDGKRTSDLLLNKSFHDDLENGHTEKFRFPDEADIGKIESVVLWMDSSHCDEDRWFCEYLLCIRHRKNGESDMYPFPLHRWIMPNRRYQFAVYDSSLPQEVKCEARIKQREEELVENSLIYGYIDDSEGLPKTTARLPDKESFTYDMKFDIGARKTQLMISTKMKEIFICDKWEDPDDIKALFKRTFDIPRGWYSWKSDYKFGDQRLNGINDYMLKRCKQLPENFPVSESTIEGFLNDQTLGEAMEEGRIFIADLNILENLPQNRLAAKICAPLGLFYANMEGELLPIAIQLNQNPAEDNPVFYPNDPKNKWLLVKMFFNYADCCIHQSTTHLGFTHLVCETIAAASCQTLSTSHPVAKVMAPHFLHLFAINKLAVEKLLAADGWVDKTMAMGSEGLQEVIRRRWKDWRMDTDAWFPSNIKIRGVDDVTILKTYYARDDKLLLHEAIRAYVHDVLSTVYDSAEKLHNDHEIQEFAKVLTSKDGAAIKGVFGGGKFEKLDDLINVVTATIFIASVSHAAANFGQYDEYSFVPNYPATLFGKVPKDKSEITTKEIASYIPDQSTILSIMIVTKLLSERATQALGQYEIKYMYEPWAVKALKRFQRRLEEIGQIINARNAKVKNPYTYLHPKEIPNAISI